MQHGHIIAVATSPAERLADLKSRRRHPAYGGNGRALALEMQILGVQGQLDKQLPDTPGDKLPFWRKA